MNKHNLKYWLKENPLWYSPSKIAWSPGIHDAGYGLWDINVMSYGTWMSFAYSFLMGPSTVNNLQTQDQIILQFDELGGRIKWFIQRGEPPYFVTHYMLLYEMLPWQCFGRRYAMEWALGYVKLQVCTVKVSNVTYLQYRIQDIWKFFSTDMIIRS